MINYYSLETGKTIALKNLNQYGRITIVFFQ